MTYLQNQRGFSLLEVLVAVTIFAVGLLAVANMQLTSVKGNSDSQLATEATALGQSHMEQLLSLPYDHNDLDPAGNPHPFTSGNYNYSWTITENDVLRNTKTIVLDIVYGARGERQVRIIAAKADVI